MREREREGGGGSCIVHSTFFVPRPINSSSLNIHIMPVKRKSLKRNHYFIFSFYRSKKRWRNTEVPFSRKLPIDTCSYGYTCTCNRICDHSSFCYSFISCIIFYMHNKSIILHVQQKCFIGGGNTNLIYIIINRPM